jgi:hypothetical protein
VQNEELLMSGVRAPTRFGIVVLAAAALLASSAFAQSPISLANPAADFEQAGFEAVLTIDGSLHPTNGWAINGGGTSRTYTVETLADFESTAGIRVRLYHRHASDHRLGHFRLSYTTDARGTFGPASGSWSVLDSNIGAFSDALETNTASAQVDGSWLVLPGGTGLADYILDYPVLTSGITGFRLEVLVDPSLPANGPGWAANGNFVVNEFEVSDEAPVAAPTPIQLNAAQADHEQASFPASATIDGSLAPFVGWAIDGGGTARTLTVDTQSDFTSTEGITVTLLNRHPDLDLRLGRFRLSYTTDARGTFGPASGSWTVLDSNLGAFVDTLSKNTATAQVDGSWLVDPGDSNPTDYQLDYPVQVVGITGFRVETLLDPSLPASGPGWAGNGNFTLTEIRVTDETTFDVDGDLDGIVDGFDNCPVNANPLQEDGDGDNVGDICDVCLSDYDPGQEDGDFDGAGDACDVCPGISDPGQEDTDYDGVGDACDPITGGGNGRLGLAYEDAGRLLVTAFTPDLTGTDPTVGEIIGFSQGLFGLAGLEDTSDVHRAFVYFSVTDDAPPVTLSFSYLAPPQYVPVNPTKVGSMPGSTASAGSSLYRADVTSLITAGIGDDLFMSVFGGSSVTGISLIITLETESVSRSNRVQIYDGAHGGTSADTIECPWPNPVTFSGLDPIIPATNGAIWYLLSGDDEVPQESFFINGASVVTSQTTLNGYNIRAHDLSADLTSPSTSLTASMCEVGEAVVWNAAILVTEEVDSDGDYIPDQDDNCLGLGNADQADSDGDGIGDACDLCVSVPNVGDSDTDGDGVGNACDTCPSVPDALNLDTDSDGEGDVCNDANDADGDEWSDALDVCPAVPDPAQIDTDVDGMGDACDACPTFEEPYENPATMTCTGQPNTLTIQYQVTTDVCEGEGTGFSFGCMPAPIGATYTVRYQASGPATIDSTGPATLLTVAGFPQASYWLGQADPVAGAAPFELGSYGSVFSLSPAGSFDNGGAFVTTGYTSVPTGLQIPVGYGSARDFRWMASEYVYGGFFLIKPQVQAFRTFAVTQPAGARGFSFIKAESQEVSRNYVPEPAASLGLMAGVLLLSCLDRRRGRYRDSRPTQSR